MKLKCVQHDRRLMILKGGGKWVHRTGDGSDCDSPTAIIGEQKIVRGTKVLTNGVATAKMDPARRLLYEIFAK